MGKIPMESLKRDAKLMLVR